MAADGVHAIAFGSANVVSHIFDIHELVRRRSVDGGTMALPVAHDLAAMEATSVDAIPESEGWQYEPKWDGFRCLVFRDGAGVDLRSKAGQPLGRYFPEVVEAMRGLAHHFRFAGHGRRDFADRRFIA